MFSQERKLRHRVSTVTITRTQNGWNRSLTNLGIAKRLFAQTQNYQRMHEICVHILSTSLNIDFSPRVLLFCVFFYSCILRRHTCHWRFSVLLLNWGIENKQGRYIEKSSHGTTKICYGSPNRDDYFKTTTSLFLLLNISLNISKVVMCCDCICAPMTRPTFIHRIVCSCA